MQQKRYIRLQVTFLAMLYLAFLVLMLTIFKQQYLHFHDEIFRKSQANLEVLHAVKKIDVSLAVYERGYANFMAKGGQKWLDHLNEAREVINSELDFLEKFNFKQIKDWVVVKEFTSEDAVEKLSGVIDGYKEGRFDSDHFQRLFYLLRYNLDQYFKTTEIDLKKSDAADGSLVMAQDTEVLGRLLVQGISQVRSVYTGLFWDHAAVSNREYDANTYRFFLGIIGGSVLLFFFALAIFFQVFVHLRRFQSRQERLVLLGAQDKITGLFHGEATRLLVSRELERSQRLGHAHTLLLLRFGPVESVRVQMGALMADKFQFHATRLVLHFFRPGESVYSPASGEILLTFQGADRKRLAKRCRSFAKAFLKQRFFKQLAKAQLVPQCEFAAAVSHVHGVSYDELLTSARTRLSSDLAHLFDFPEAPALVPDKSSSGKSSAPLAEAQTDVAPDVPEESVEIPSAAFRLPRQVEEPLASERVAPQVTPTTDTTAAVIAPTERSLVGNPLAEHFEGETVAVGGPPRRDDEITADGIESHADLPDVVAAMMQDAASPEPVPPVSHISAAVRETGDTESVTDESMNVSDIEVVQNDAEDVILVDFDREKSDLAERFRRRIQTQRKGS